MDQVLFEQIKREQKNYMDTYVIRAEDCFVVRVISMAYDRQTGYSRTSYKIYLYDNLDQYVIDAHNQFVKETHQDPYLNIERQTAEAQEEATKEGKVSTKTLIPYIEEFALRISNYYKIDYYEAFHFSKKLFSEYVLVRAFKNVKRKWKRGCFIATAVYGSYDCPEVWILRRYRDMVLDSTWFGKIFINLYYFFSPTIVKIFGNKSWFKHIWRNVLDKKIKKLKRKGYEDTPYKDKF
jgi:hypothetical protein